MKGWLPLSPNIELKRTICWVVSQQKGSLVVPALLQNWQQISPTAVAIFLSWLFSSFQGLRCVKIGSSSGVWNNAVPNRAKTSPIVSHLAVIESKYSEKFIVECVWISLDVLTNI